VAIAEQILGSLAEAHGAGVVHRDVKPANVMLAQTREGDYVKVLDFGIAKLRDAAGDDTTQGVILGTPNYLAPEQARGEPLDPRADLYSVGALLYELVSGRPPFAGRHPMAVLQAHLSEDPLPLRQVAPDASPALAAVVHRALSKRPEDRFPSAGEMRQALLALRGGAPRTRTGSPMPALGLASRADVEDYERARRRPAPSRLAAPLGAALLLLALAGLAAWRWSDLLALLQRRAPALAELVPASLRPAAPGEGVEREPNDTPEQASPLAFAPGPDGRPGTAQVRGHVGPRLGPRLGDVDVYRLEVPDLGRPVVLLAEWNGAAPGDGIPGLQISLTLNRDRPGPGGRHTAPLVAQAARGGPGRPQRLEALVEPGSHWLAVRERHDEAAGPVERPHDWYLLRVWLRDIRAGEEVEPNDEPERVEGVARRYPAWRALAERNAIAEGERFLAETSTDDPDAFALVPRGSSARPEAVALVPAPGLALTAQRWLPDAEDLAPGAGDRQRFEEAAEGGPGEMVIVRLPAPAAGAPPLLRVRAVRGEGRYEVLALGPRSGPLVLERAEALAGEGRGAAALELAAAFAREVPAAAGRTEVLVAAGRLAERLAPGLEPRGVPAFDGASRRLGAAVFEVAGGAVRYGAAFEALAHGLGPLDEEALIRATGRVLPCTPDEVARRARAFLSRFPRSARAGEARLQLARALEEDFWRGGDRAALGRARSEYAALARGKGNLAEEAEARAQDLARARPERPAVSRIRCE
jgi:serine/threonine-protein kinase